MNYPKISVITTCFNKEKYVRQCIESVLRCQYPNFEYIIVDDNSTDTSWSIISEFAAAHTVIIAARNEKNIGDYPNRNKAVGMSSGELIKFIDADDLVYPFALHYLVYHMLNNPDCGLCLTVQPERNAQFPIKLNFRELMKLQYVSKKLYLFEGPTSALIRKSSLTGVNGFNESRMSGDFETWHKISLISSVLLLPKGSLTFWRFHDESEGGVHRSDANWQIKYFDFSISFLQNHCFSENQQSQELETIRTDFFRWCFFILRKRGFIAYNKLYSKNKLSVFGLIAWAISYYLRRLFIKKNLSLKPVT
jgi:glycosyltransferase involved in cell wall biosynthesis